LNLIEFSPNFPELSDFNQYSSIRSDYNNHIFWKIIFNYCGQLN